MNTLSRFKGAFLASALGDAIGELAFSFSSKRSLLIGIEQKSRLIYTDDTAMAIALAEYLLEDNSLNIEKLGAKFAYWYNREPWRGYGPGPPKIFSLVQKQGMTFNEAANVIYPDGSFGNGSSMRVTPAALLFYKDRDLYDKIKLTCLPTHTHPLAVDGAVILAKAVGLLLEVEVVDDESFISLLVKTAKTDEFKSRLYLLKELLIKGSSLYEVAKILGNRPTALESVPFAIYAFLANKHDFKNGLLDEVDVPGDKDTVGCMSSALWGAYLGVEAIPKEWLDKLENRDYIETLSVKLFHKTHLK